MNRVKLKIRPPDMRVPVPVGTLGDVIKDWPSWAYTPYVWVHFDGTTEAQTMLPCEIEPANVDNPLTK